MLYRFIHQATLIAEQSPSSATDQGRPVTRFRRLPVVPSTLAPPAAAATWWCHQQSKHYLMFCMYLEYVWGSNGLRKTDVRVRVPIDRLTVQRSIALLLARLEVPHKTTSSTDAQGLRQRHHPHQPPTRADNTVSAATGGTAHSGTYQYYNI